jgi:hypothetical protein
MSTSHDIRYRKTVNSSEIKKTQIPQYSAPTTDQALYSPVAQEQNCKPTSTLKEGPLPPRHLIRQFDGERALRDAEAAGLLSPRTLAPRRTSPTPEMVALATVYVTAMFANTETLPSNEERIAKISEVASFYSEPHRQERFKALVGAIVS